MARTQLLGLNLIWLAAQNDRPRLKHQSKVETYLIVLLHLNDSKRPHAKQDDGGSKMAATAKNPLKLEEVPEFFGPRVLGRIMGIAEGQAYNLARSQGFPAIRVGRKLLISKRGLIRWMQERGLA